MNKFSGWNLLAGVGTVLFLWTTPVLACMCPYVKAPLADQVRGALKTSTAVFIGKVIGFEYQRGMLYERHSVERLPEEVSQQRETRLIRFEVERWWKMAQPAEVLIITDQWRPVEQPAEEPQPDGVVLLLPRSFASSGCGVPFVKGQSYLVYADGLPGRLQYGVCSRTTGIDRAGDDLKILGKGKNPTKNR